MASIVYLCDCCGKSFNTIDRAVSCEERHIKPLAITNFVYKDDNKKQPNQILVKMSDNTSVWYYREPQPPKGRFG